MRLCEFAQDSANLDAQSLLALSALLKRQNLLAGAAPKINIDAFVKLAGNVGIKNLTRRSLVDLSTKPPLNNIIKKIEGTEVYFIDDSGDDTGEPSEPGSDTSVTDPQRQAALNQATVDKMADRQAKKALKK